LNPDEANKIYKLDLERGAVVEEWKTGHDFPVHDLLCEEKLANSYTSTSTLLGLNTQGVVYLDSRLPGEKQVKEKSFMYSLNANPKLNVATTTKNGELAIGSRDGKIRLYSENTFRKIKADDPEHKVKAKTELPGLGDPIIGIDVTANGKWILATCNKYLLIIPTEFGNHRSGFQVGMGKDKPAPRRLTLKPDDIQAIGGPEKINFTPAKFSVGDDQETSIVTTTGPYVITWNFTLVKQNKLQAYVIRKHHKSIVTAQFQPNDPKSIVSCMPDEVSLVKRVKRQLKF